MKNVHIIPTDKPTGIFDSNSGLQFSIMDKVRTGPLKGFHIYITSNEEIKEEDYVQHTQMFNHMGFTGIAKVGKQRVNQEFEMTSLDGHYSYYSCKEPKVILTTDQDLIKDDVQKIDDNFIEWFVNHPSCESVEVNIDYSKSVANYSYKIIIPKKEPKDFLGRKTFDLLKQEAIEEEMVEFDKQETLEEVAERYLSNNTDEFDFRRDSKFWNFGMKLIRFGAKWEKKRSYSKEDSFENKSLKWWMTLSMDEQVEIGFKYDMPTYNLTLRAIMHEFEQFKKK